MIKLTDRQREMLRVIDRHITQTGLRPTFRELGEALGIKSTNGVSDHLRALIRKGYVNTGSNKARTIALTAAGLRAIGSTTVMNAVETQRELDRLRALQRHAFVRKFDDFARESLTDPDVTDIERDFWRLARQVVCGEGATA